MVPGEVFLAIASLQGRAVALQRPVDRVLLGVRAQGSMTRGYWEPVERRKGAALGAHSSGNPERCS